MREPAKTKCAKSKRYPGGVKWSGAVEYRGRQEWVGTFATADDWKKEAEKRMKGLREAHQAESGGAVPTVAEAVGVEVRADGRLIPIDEDENKTWPRSHPRQGLKASSAERDREHPSVRSPLRHPPINSFTRPEARQIAADLSNGQKAAVRRLFGDLYDDGLVDRNHFERLCVKQRSRLERADFEIVTEAQLERLLDCAVTSRVDDYGLTVRALILAEATLGVRPGELFALEWPDLDYQEGVIHLRHNVDDLGVVTELKNSLARLAPLTDELAEAIDAAPRLSPTHVFPAIRGGQLRLSLWHDPWNTARAMAGLPGLEFYSLKHRAITHMCTPKPDGLGLDPGDVAEIVGHRDGGKTIIRHYLKRDQRKAIARFHTADAQWRAQADRADGNQGGLT